jgi:hypothetical protein
VVGDDATCSLKSLEYRSKKTEGENGLTAEGCRSIIRLLSNVHNHPFHMDVTPAPGQDAGRVEEEQVKS